MGMQSFFYPQAQFLLYAAVVQGNGTGQLRGHIQQGLVPTLCHPSCIDEDESGVASLNNGHHFFGQLNAEVSSPWIFFYLIRYDAMHGNVFAHLCFYNYTGLLQGAEQYFTGFIEVANGGGNTPE